jgi:hypothetical protein
MDLADQGVADPSMTEARRIVEASSEWDAVAMAARDGDLRAEIARRVRDELGRELAASGGCAGALRIGQWLCFRSGSNGFAL